MPLRSLLKAALFALIAGTTAAYVVVGRATEALESIAWYVLLILFAAEAGWPGHVGGSAVVRAVHALRAVATAAIIVAGVGYLQEREWLDAINTGLWIAVVLLMEAEVRQPAAVAEHRRACAALAAVLYSALALLAAIWAAHGEWLDAADALLWLAAFAVIEIDILTPPHGTGAAPRPVRRIAAETPSRTDRDRAPEDR